MNTGEILDGRYEIIARLGAGGMGEVYKAKHTFLGAARVIKVVRPHIAENTDARERFLREARVATKVQHPNVATLHDFAALPDGSHYMVWEFIEGENLAQRLRARGTLPPKQAVHIAVQALRGLEAIHRAGIIHRDISPENLMITPDDTVKIIDLGVAKLEDPDAVSQTRTGIFVGKLRYAAPEQLGFLAEGEKIDGRTDLYALAMVVVELLTGRPPYEAKSPHEYFLHHAREIPTTSVELPATLPGSIALQQVLQKALARNRDERFLTAREFATALEEIERNLPDAGQTPTVAMALDGDDTWRPSAGVITTQKMTTPAAPAPPAQAASTPTMAAAPTLNTPLPPIGTPTPVPAAAPPPPSGNRAAIAIAAVLLFAVVAVGGGAVLLWPSIRHAIAPEAKTPPPVTASTATEPARSATSSISVTPSTTTTTTASDDKPLLTASAVVTPPRDAVNPALTLAKPKQPADQKVAVVTRPVDTSETELVQTETVQKPRNPAVFVEAPGHLRRNDRAMDRLHEELRGVKEVSLLAGRHQLEVYRALHRVLPELTFNAEAPVIIRFDMTPERLGRERANLSAGATIEKNGRVIFRYDLPNNVDPGSAADSFAQTVAEAFE